MLHDRSERVTSMLLGVAVGDALGWPFEMPKRVVSGPDAEGPFFRWRRRAGSRFWSYEESLPPGTYSDDTQLTLATARSLLHEDWFKHLVSRELPSWRLYERGAGRTVLRSAAAWTRGRAPWRQRPDERQQYFGSGANGAAMRISPHLVIGDGPLRRVLADAIVTHGHPRALLGATLHACALQSALADDLGTNALEAVEAAADQIDRWGDPTLLDELPESWRSVAGADYEERWVKHRDHTRDLLSRATRWADRGASVAESEVLEDLGATDPKTNGAGDVCAVAAIYLAGRYASQPAHALRAAARQPGADTDTLASMVGALLGAWLGQDAVESFPGVQDAEMIKALAADLAAAPDPETRIVDDLDPRPATVVDEFTTGLEQGPTEVELPDGRPATVIQQRTMSDQGSNNQVIGHYLRCDDGQGLLVVSRHKRRSDRRTGAEKTEATEDEQARLGTGAADGPDVEGGSTRTVAVVVRSTDPEAIVAMLKCTGLTSTAAEPGWQVDGLPVTIAATDDREPQLQLETPPCSVEIRVTVDNLDRTAELLRAGGWTPKREEHGLTVQEGSVLIRATDGADEFTANSEVRDR